MGITGCDSIIFTAVDPRAALLKSIELLRQRWGGARLEVESPIDQTVSLCHACPPLSLDQLAPESGYILVLRDHEMDKFMVLNGYALMSDGDGPVAFWYRQRGPVSFQLAGVKEVETKEALKPNLDVAPYDAWLCSSVLFEITVVTPEWPIDDPFSSWIVNQVKQVCLTL